MLIDDSGAWVTHYYYDADGNLTDSKDWNYYSGSFDWSSTHQRLYFFRDGTSPNDLMYEEVSVDGQITGNGDSPYHGDYTFTGPIVVSPDQTNVLLGSGEYYDSLTLSRVGSISRNFDHAVYLDNGRLAIIRKNGVDTILVYYDTAYAPVPGVTTIPGEPVSLSYHNNQLTVVTYDVIQGLVPFQVDNP